MSKYTLSATALSGEESYFGVDEVRRVFLVDNVFYIGDVPYALDSIECVELAAANARIARLEAALNKIASWDEGAEVTSQFDEPFAARYARAALAKE